MTADTTAGRTAPWRRALLRTLPAFLLLALVCGCGAPGMAPLDGMQVSAGATGTNQSQGPATIPIRLVSQRIVFDVELEAPGGRRRKALAWFNMGMSSPILLGDLYHELGIDRGEPLRLRLGAFAFDVPAKSVAAGGNGSVAGPDFKALFAPAPVEIMLPIGLFREFRVSLDYKARVLTLAKVGQIPAGQLPPEGEPVPCAVNSKTGLIGVQASIDGQSVPVVLDAGSGYSWMRGDVVAGWLRRHPDWARAHGAVGPANANMLDYAFEKDGEVIRVPVVTLAGLRIDNVGMMGTGPILGDTLDGLFGNFFWDNWQRSAPFPIAGWLGTNVLHNYKLTIDYPNRMTYWLKQSDMDVHELDQVGVTLVRRGDRYFIGELVSGAGGGTDGELTRQIKVGDELLAVDAVAVTGAPRDAVLAALHGTPGEQKTLVVMHSGAPANAAVRVAAFD